MAKLVINNENKRAQLLQKSTVTFQSTLVVASMKDFM
ncbi:hypothetical protein CIY_12780 [Butyrivibrio fibrisolvens 16/4]|nr:hypothetical protein CIY_12780 [Butyrivibrio fibrisolvens 16/4]